MYLRLVIGETLMMRPLHPKSIEVAQQEELEINVMVDMLLMHPLDDK